VSRCPRPQILISAHHHISFHILFRQANPNGTDQADSAHAMTRAQAPALHLILEPASRLHFLISSMSSRPHHNKSSRPKATFDFFPVGHLTSCSTQKEQLVSTWRSELFQARTAARGWNRTQSAELNHLLPLYVFLSFPASTSPSEPFFQTRL
jgi:hypothetical protein